MKILIPAFFALTSSSFATALIANGDLVGSKDLASKTQVMLISQTTTSAQKTCSGTIISDKCVLTARHCIEGIIASSIGFNRNIDKLTEDHIIEADKVFGHPKADLAVLKFSNGLPPGYLAATLGERELTLDIGSPVTAYGYSAPKPYGTDFGVLRKFETKLKALNSDKLSTPGPTTDKIPATYKGMINGDSGGALFTKTANGELRVVGVHEGLISKMGIGLDVRIQKYLPWVKTYCKIKE